MGQPPQRCLYTPNHNRHLRPEFFKNLGIYGYRVVRAHSRCPVGRIGICAPQPLCRSVVIYHRVHSSCRDSKEEPWSAQLAEITQIVSPIGLRHNGNPVTCRFQDSADYSCTKRGMIYVSISANEDNIHIIPSPCLHLLPGSGRKQIRLGHNYILSGSSIPRISIPFLSTKAISFNIARRKSNLCESLSLRMETL